MLEIWQNRRERDHDPVYDVKETKEQRGQPSHGLTMDFLLQLYDF
jgi:hypothetical protein